MVGCEIEKEFMVAGPFAFYRPVPCYTGEDQPLLQYCFDPCGHLRDSGREP